MTDVLDRNVDPSVVERLKRKAAERHVSFSAVAREALSAYAEADRGRLIEEVREAAPIVTADRRLLSFSGRLPRLDIRPLAA